MNHSHDPEVIRLWLRRLLDERLPKTIDIEPFLTRLGAVFTQEGQFFFPGIGFGHWEDYNGQVITVSAIIHSGVKDIDWLFDQLILDPISDWGSANSLLADGMVIHTWRRGLHLVDIALIKGRPLLLLRIHDAEEYPKTLAAL